MYSKSQIIRSSVANLAQVLLLHSFVSQLYSLVALAMAPKAAVQATTRLLETTSTVTVKTVTTTDDGKTYVYNRESQSTTLTTTPSKRRRLEDDVPYSEASHYGDDRDDEVP